MIKLVFCLHRLPHLSRENFRKYWHRFIDLARSPLFVAEEHEIVPREK